MLTLPYAGRPRKMWLSEKVTHTSQEIIHNKSAVRLVPLHMNQGFPILASFPLRRPPHPIKMVSVPWRAPPATAHSPFLWGGAAFAEGSWREWESPVEQ